MNTSAFTLPDPKSSGRLLLIDALRAFASSTIAWHHFACYPPLSDWVASIDSGIIEWFRDYARATQVFFVVGGFVIARSLSGSLLSSKKARDFILRRYCRLGIPYLAAIALAMIACWLGRDSLPSTLVGSPPTISQLLAHVVFLQDILGYESLSAGLWFVCINFQLTLIYLAMLCFRDAIASRCNGPVVKWAVVAQLLAGWILAAASLFYFNIHVRFDIWALYYFGYFFLGVMVEYGLRNQKSAILYWLYVLLILSAMLFHWRWRLLTALVTSLVLFVGSRLGLMERWPKSRVLQYLGQRSYSLFLIHFPILVLVAAIWVRLEWTSGVAGLVGLLIAYLVSLAAAELFFRTFEAPSAHLGKNLLPSTQNLRNRILALQRFKF